MYKKGGVLYPKLSFKLNGLFYQTHNQLGKYKNEKQYSDYFESLLKKEEMEYYREHPLQLEEEGQGNIRSFVDFMVENKVILEFKTKQCLTKEDYYQVQRYLTTVNLELAILVNFRKDFIHPKRVLNTELYKK